KPAKGAIVVDARSEKTFKKGHIEGAINIQNGGKFETWLGSIVGPDERYYLIAESEDVLNELINKAAKIGYELLIEGAFVQTEEAESKSPVIDVEEFKQNENKY